MTAGVVMVANLRSCSVLVGEMFDFLGGGVFVLLLTGSVSRPLEMKATASASTCFRA